MERLQRKWEAIALTQAISKFESREGLNPTGTCAEKSPEKKAEKPVKTQ